MKVAALLLLLVLSGCGGRTADVIACQQALGPAPREDLSVAKREGGTWALQPTVSQAYNAKIDQCVAARQAAR